MRFRHLAVFFTLLLPGPVLAAQTGSARFLDAGRVINAIACNAAAGSRTWQASAGQGAGFGLATLQFDFVHNAATAVGMTCYGSLNNGTTWSELQSCSTASGVCTSYDATWTKSVSGADTWIWRVDFLGASDIKCVMSCTAGGGSDNVTVYARFSDQ